MPISTHQYIYVSISKYDGVLSEKQKMIEIQAESCTRKLVIKVFKRLKE